MNDFDFWITDSKYFLIKKKKKYLTKFDYKKVFMFTVLTYSFSKNKDSALKIYKAKELMDYCEKIVDNFGKTKKFRICIIGNDNEIRELKILDFIKLAKNFFDRKRFFD